MLKRFEKLLTGRNSKRLYVSAPLLVVMLLAASSFSLPRFSIKYATSCSSCHINPTGGAMRNEFGNHTMAFQELVLPQTKKLVQEKYKLPRLGEGVTYGFDARYKVFDDLTIARQQTDFFLALEPFGGFQYYLRIANGGITEQYALLKLKNDRYYIKAGQFHPSFGLHNADYDSFNMARTGHSVTLFLDGIAFGTEYSGFSLALEAFNPAQRGVYGIHLFKTGRIDKFGYLLGGSLQLSEHFSSRQGNGPHPHAKALFGGVNYDRFTLEGELDLAGRSNDTLIAYANFTTRLEYGLYFITEYNFFDGNRNLSNGVDEFLRFSVELFPLPFVEFRPSYTRYTRGFQAGQDGFFVQFHVGY